MKGKAAKRKDNQIKHLFSPSTTEHKIAEIIPDFYLLLKKSVYMPAFILLSDIIRLQWRLNSVTRLLRITAAIGLEADGFSKLTQVQYFVKLYWTEKTQGG